MSGLIVSLAILAVIVGGAAYVYFGRKKATAAALAVPPFSKYLITYSQGLPSEMPKDTNGKFYFDFPQGGGWAGYFATTSTPIKVGSTITLKFTLSGTGKLIPMKESGSGSPAVHLLLWRQNDNMALETYRYWSSGGVELTKTGQFTLSQIVDPAKWTDVYGKPGTDNPADFTALLNNLAYLGFTFGAEFFGHGVYAAGNVRFTLDSLTVT